MVPMSTSELWLVTSCRSISIFHMLANYLLFTTLPFFVQHDGSTPMYWASYYGNIEVMNLLIAHGAAINVRDEVSHVPR